MRKPRMVRVTLYPTDDQMLRLKERAKELHISVSTVVRGLLIGRSRSPQRRLTGDSLFAVAIYRLT